MQIALASAGEKRRGDLKSPEKAQLRRGGSEVIVRTIQAVQALVTEFQTLQVRGNKRVHRSEAGGEWLSQDIQDADVNACAEDKAKELDHYMMVRGPAYTSRRGIH